MPTKVPKSKKQHKNHRNMVVLMEKTSCLAAKGVILMLFQAFYSQHPLPLYLVRRLCAAHLFACLFLELRQAHLFFGNGATGSSDSTLWSCSGAWIRPKPFLPSIAVTFADHRMRSLTYLEKVTYQS